MATFTQCTYGTYEHGVPYYNDRQWFRVDQWNGMSSEGRDRLFAAGWHDDSPIYRGGYNPKCSCCYLGFAHTELAHHART